MEKNCREMLENGILGFAVADALGVPVEFEPRSERDADPVTGMRGYGTFNLPAGSWSDDTSMTLATLDSIAECGGVVPEDIMARFEQWVFHSAYNVDGRQTFDVGIATRSAVSAYHRGVPLADCSCRGEQDNGNGSLMRILPVCLWAIRGGNADAEAVEAIHTVSDLTHGHLRSKIACGLYYFLAKAILNGTGSLNERLQQGIDAGFAFYRKDPACAAELAMFGRVEDLASFRALPRSEIESSGYVLHTFQAVLWCLLNEESYAGSALRAVNLGRDTDTVAAICGGLAGLWYGLGGIPAEWLDTLHSRDFIEGIIAKAV